MLNESQNLVWSFDIADHPILGAKPRTRADYYSALSYLVRAVQSACSQNGICISDEYISSRLGIYQSNLILTETAETDKGRDQEKFREFVSSFRRKKQRLLLMCDAALILSEPDAVRLAADHIGEMLSKLQNRSFRSFADQLMGTDDVEIYPYVEGMFRQYRQNRRFADAECRKIIITANMSAGKSTLVNALIGSKIAKTSQEVCTVDNCYLYDSALDDGNIHIGSPVVMLDAESKDVAEHHAETASVHFRCISDANPRVCLVDTPGVNAALYREHGSITYDTLSKEDADKVVYVISPTNLGTDAEIEHMRWVAKNVPAHKVVFVLNKVDDFNSKVDDVDESVSDLAQELKELGFEDPVICPVSAYFGLLLKLKRAGASMNEDEQDEYELLLRRFNRDYFDMTRFYPDVTCTETDDEIMRSFKRSGMFGLEKIIYGEKV